MVMFCTPFPSVFHPRPLPAALSFHQTSKNQLIQKASEDIGAQLAATLEAHDVVGVSGLMEVETPKTPHGQRKIWDL